LGSWRVRIARFPNHRRLFAHTRLTLFVHNRRFAADKRRDFQGQAVVRGFG
jgi:hypothetical protein